MPRLWCFRNMVPVCQSSRVKASPNDRFNDLETMRLGITRVIAPAFAMFASFTNANDMEIGQ
jgi:hypothetical protein